MDLALQIQIDRDRARARQAKARQADSDDLSAKVKLPALYPLQQQIKDEAARFNVICIGRRAGKTYLCTHLALETALQGDPVGWFVPDYKVAAEVWREVSRALKPVATKNNATERRIELENGGVIEIWTLENEDAGRGRKYKRVIVDEAAMAPRLKTAWEQAISPTLTDLKGDAWFPSTPKGLNFYFDLFQMGLDPDQPDWKSSQLPSSVNPFLPPDEIERQRGMLPEQVFQQEYLATFLQNDGAVFRNVDACLVSQATKPGEHRKHTIVGGLDWARQNDFTVLCLYCCTCNREVLLDRFNQIGWELQRSRVLGMCDDWGVSYCTVETNSIGSPLLDRLQIESNHTKFIGFETTGQSKPPLIQSLSLSFERTLSRWLPDTLARMELVSFEATTTIHGHVRYAAAEGRHDDTVIARALAWRQAKLRINPPPSVAEQVEEEMPAEWRTPVINAMPVHQRDVMYAARMEEYEEAKERITNKRRPKLNWSDALDEGGIGDID